MASISSPRAVTAKEAKAEAKYLLKLIKDYDITLNVAYDWEYIDNVDFRHRPDG